MHTIAILFLKERFLFSAERKIEPSPRRQDEKVDSLSEDRIQGNPRRRRETSLSDVPSDAAAIYCVMFDAECWQIIANDYQSVIPFKHSQIQEVFSLVHY